MDKSVFCQGAMEESVRWDAEINTTQKEAVSHLTDTYRGRSSSLLHISALANKSPPAEDNQPN